MITPLLRNPNHARDLLSAEPTILGSLPIGMLIRDFGTDARRFLLALANRLPCQTTSFTRLNVWLLN